MPGYSQFVSPAEKWLRTYAEATNAAASKALDWASIPLLVVSLIGMLWSIPVPEVFRESSPTLNWGTLFLMATLVYYFILSITLAFGALPFVVLVIALLAWIDALGIGLRPLSAGVFALAFAAQLLGRRSMGRPMNPLRNLQYLMLGPLWLLATVYRRLNIPL